MNGVDHVALLQQMGKENNPMKFWVTTVIGIILFAIATAILYMIGLKKEMGRDNTLSEILLSKGSQKVVSYLKKHDTISKKEVEGLVRSIKSSVFYSKQRARVSDPNSFSKALLDTMLEKDIITRYQKGYRLKKRK